MLNWENRNTVCAAEKKQELGQGDLVLIAKMGVSSEQLLPQSSPRTLPAFFGMWYRVATLTRRS